MRTLPLLAVAFALVAGCTIGDEATTTTADERAATATPGVLYVDAPPGSLVPSDFTTAILEDGSYQHRRLEVGAQTTVIWWNVDDVVHSVVSDDGQFAGSGPIAPGGEFVRTFQRPGEYAYHCRYHLEMRGTIVVG